MATQSMTGFGRGSAEMQSVTIEVEIRAVNHRFLDLSCKLPSVYAGFERDIAALARSKVNRGRLDISVSRTESEQKDYDLTFNENLFRAYWDAAAKGFDIAGVLSKTARALAVTQVLTRREIVEIKPHEQDVETEKSGVLEAVEKALTELAEMRAKEGAELAKDLEGHVSTLEGFVEKLKTSSGDSVEQFRTRLEERVQKLNLPGEVDPQRLAQEVALMAEKTDVTEELSRMGSHVGQFRALLAERGTGRKMEFLIQEMGREINTCGSKSQSSEIAALIVDSKGVLEKMREQVQNIE